ncbi:hypothetical protein BH20GEM1_BH20GEM1_15170 [soil metagenome]
MRIEWTMGILAAALTLPACSGDSGPTAIEIPLARVEITAPCPDIPLDSTCQIGARGITADNELVTNAVLRWSSSNGSVAQVDSEGLVRAMGSGTATITVEAALGSGSATTRVSVRPVFEK